MAVYDLEEQEQLDAAKAWWKQHGNLVTGVVTVAALAFAGMQGWNWYQRKQADEASAVYAVLSQSVASRDMKQVRDAAGELAEKYGGTAQAALGALAAARAHVEAGDLKTARTQLAWVAEHAGDEAVRDLARLRLAAVLLDDKAYDEALKQVDKAPQDAFAARYLEMKGDILAVQNKAQEARAAYEAAMAKLDAQQKAGTQTGAGRELLRLKLDALGD